MVRLKKKKRVAVLGCILCFGTRDGGGVAAGGVRETLRKGEIEREGEREWGGGGITGRHARKTAGKKERVRVDP